MSAEYSDHTRYGLPRGAQVRYVQSGDFDNHEDRLVRSAGQYRIQTLPRLVATVLVKKIDGGGR